MCSNAASMQLWNMYFDLERGVTLLEGIASDADHTNHICRFRSTVLPFLNRTVSVAITLTK